jgi:hypothetical protein
VATLLWGRVGTDVGTLDVIFQDGSQQALAHPHGVFLYPVSAAHWVPGHRPAFVSAHKRHGQLLAKRLLYEFTLAPRR